MDVISPHPTAFRNAAAEAARREPGLAWLAAVRDRALQRFAKSGFPTTAEEDWRYTDLRETANLTTAYVARSPQAAARESLAAIRERLVTGGAGPLVVLVDGMPAPDLCWHREHPGLAITTLTEADPAARDALAARIEGDSRTDAGALAAMNAALLRQGLVIELAPGADIGAPIMVACAGTPESAGQNRIMVRLGAGSRATLIEHHLSLGASVSNSVTDVICEPGSQLVYVKLQDESPAASHLAAQRFALDRDARAELLHLDIGARLARNDLRVELAGHGAGVSAHGLFFADGERHLDNHTRIEHRAPRTLSRELYRGVMDGSGRGVFNGKVIAHAGAAGTDAQLTNQNLLLSAKAEVDTKPELEIYADDVKCSHGATTGQLDANAIFYLRSRGIPEDQARRMLIASFVREIVARLPAGPLEAHVAALLGERLPDLLEVAGPT
jgi:Fe-S cluster assembly protein SufD